LVDCFNPEQVMTLSAEQMGSSLEMVTSQYTRFAITPASPEDWCSAAENRTGFRSHAAITL
jgi:hypothetical protein